MAMFDSIYQIAAMFDSIFQVISMTDGKVYQFIKYQQ